MGNSYCKDCGVQLSGSGNMCSRCYEKRHLQTCSVCGYKINAGDETLCGVHMFPCYGNKYKRCCKCNESLDGISTKGYCKDCYDSHYPPPRKLHFRKGDAEMTIYSRDDSLQQLQPLCYAIGRGLSDGGRGRLYLQ